MLASYCDSCSTFVQQRNQCQFSAIGFPCGSAGKESAWNAGDLGSIPGLGRSPGEGKGYPLRCSGVENSMDCIVHIIKGLWEVGRQWNMHRKYTKTWGMYKNLKTLSIFSQSIWIYLFRHICDTRHVTLRKQYQLKEWKRGIFWKLTSL